MKKVDILRNSKFCFGPMSKNIVDAIIQYSNDTKTPITLIPSRRQIEYDGGYVNNWTTKEFISYVNLRSKYIAIQRDHGGPGQGSKDDDGYCSLEEDCKYMDSIHIDPWKKYSKYEDGLKWTIDMINYCEQRNPNLYYEVGTEEAIRKFTTEEIEKFLHDLKEKLIPDIFKKIIFCVVQSGTRLENCENTGHYSSTTLREQNEIVRKYNIFSKEHNGDYMNEKTLTSRFTDKLNAVNIAPELGTCETIFIMDKIKEDDKDLFFNICYESKKWNKWINLNIDPLKNKEKIILVSGHYCFSDERMKKLKERNMIHDNDIIKYIYEYIDKKFQTIQLVQESMKKINTLACWTVPSKNQYDDFNNFIFSDNISLISKLLVRHEYYLKTVNIPGHIVECGVFKGSGMASWLKMLQIYEPNSPKKVIGFDFFSNNINETINIIENNDYNCKDRLIEVVTRAKDNELTKEKIGNILSNIGVSQKKYELVSGDIQLSCVNYIENNPGFHISLLYMDLDLGEPTYYALNVLWDRVLPGGYILFDDYQQTFFDESMGVNRFLKERNLAYIIESTKQLQPCAYIKK